METYLVHAKVSNPANPRVYFDLKIDNQPIGRITMELYADVTPKAAEYFRCLCTGEKGKDEDGEPLHYKDKEFYLVWKNNFATSDIGSLSTFTVENFSRKSMKRGDIAMHLHFRTST